MFNFLKRLFGRKKIENFGSYYWDCSECSSDSYAGCLKGNDDWYCILLKQYEDCNDCRYVTTMGDCAKGYENELDCPRRK